MLLAMAESEGDKPLFHAVISASPYLPTQWSVIFECSLRTVTWLYYSQLHQGLLGYATI